MEDYTNVFIDGLLSWIEAQVFSVTGQLQITGYNVQVLFNATLPANFECQLDKDPPVPCEYI